MGGVGGGSRGQRGPGAPGVWLQRAMNGGDGNSPLDEGSPGCKQSLPPHVARLLPGLLRQVQPARLGISSEREEVDGEDGVQGQAVGDAALDPACKGMVEKAGRRNGSARVHGGGPLTSQGMHTSSRCRCRCRCACCRRPAILGRWLDCTPRTCPCSPDHVQLGADPEDDGPRDLHERGSPHVDGAYLCGGGVGWGW